ncbi:alpha/beta fold hydrolase [Micromonospora rubida]
MNASPTSTVLRPRPGLDLTDAVPNARSVLIPDAGHLPMREAPDETFSVIDAFLTDETFTKD